MSDTVHYKGKLIPVATEDTLEATAKRVMKEEGTELKDWVDDWRYIFDDNFYREYIIIDDKIYKADYKELNSYDDIMNATINEDGSIDFEIKYYNGGCGFCEALEESVEKEKKTK